VHKARLRIREHLLSIVRPRAVTAAK